MNDNQITFYEHEFYMFSNFSAFAVEVFGIDRQTSEHAYQAAKFMQDGNSDELKDTIVNEIRLARSAHDSKKIAAKYVDQVRSDRDEVKVAKMEEIIRHKHDQHPYIQKKLAQTLGKEIIEDSPKDAFRGRGPNKDGQNMLGKLWMKLRDELY